MLVYIVTSIAPISVCLWLVCVCLDAERKSSGRENRYITRSIRKAVHFSCSAAHTKLHLSYSGLSLLQKILMYWNIAYIDIFSAGSVGQLYIDTLLIVTHFQCTCHIIIVNLYFFWYIEILLIMIHFLNIPVI